LEGISRRIDSRCRWPGCALVTSSEVCIEPESACDEVEGRCVRVLVAGRPGDVGLVHEITGLRAPTGLVSGRFDDTDERRQANRALGVSALGLAVTGVVELVIALITGSVGLLGDALHNLSDVSTSLVVFLGFRVSRRAASERYPYGLQRAEDLAGLGVAVVIWASAVFAGIQSIHKLSAIAGSEPASQRPAEDHAGNRVASSVEVRIASCLLTGTAFAVLLGVRGDGQSPVTGNPSDGQRWASWRRSDTARYQVPVIACCPPASRKQDRGSPAVAADGAIAGAVVTAARNARPAAPQAP